LLSTIINKLKNMKKIIAICFMLAALINYSTAQTVNKNNNKNTASSSGFEKFFTAGPRLGLNISNIDGVDDLKSKAGLVAGAFILYSFEEHFGVSADVLYSMEGAKFTDVTTIGDATTRTENNISLSYLRIPILANVFFCDYGSAFRPKLFLGPSPGLLMGAKNKFKSVTTQNNGEVITVEDKDDVKNDFTGGDMGIMVGGGFNYRLAEYIWWNIDLRYYIGTSDINKNHPAGNSNDLKNNSLSATFGIGIGL
jgi:hypothetical protein